MNDNRIRQLRKEKGIIQETLALELGISQQLLSKYERDISKIKIDVLNACADYFDVTVDYILGRAEYRKCEDNSSIIRMARADEHNKTSMVEHDLLHAIYKEVCRIREEVDGSSKRIDSINEYIGYDNENKQSEWECPYIRKFIKLQ